MIFYWLWKHLRRYVCSPDAWGFLLDYRAQTLHFLCTWTHTCVAEQLLYLQSAEYVKDTNDFPQLSEKAILQ